MRRRLLILAVLWAGCGEDAPPSLDGVGQTLPEPPPRPYHDRNAELYDADGVPRESAERVAGLVLPRGLDAQPSRDPRRHVYTSAVPPQKLLRYFGPRLVTMNIERRGEQGAVYRDATPRGVQGGVVPLDVTIEPSSRHASRVEIYERPPQPPPGTSIPPEEIRRHFEGQQRTAE